MLENKLLRVGGGGGGWVAGSNENRANSASSYAWLEAWAELGDLKMPMLLPNQFFMDKTLKDAFLGKRDAIFFGIFANLVTFPIKYFPN